MCNLLHTNTNKQKIISLNSLEKHNFKFIKCEEIKLLKSKLKNSKVNGYFTSLYYNTYPYCKHRDNSLHNYYTDKMKIITFSRW